MKCNRTNTTIELFKIVSFSAVPFLHLLCMSARSWNFYLKENPCLFSNKLIIEISFNFSNFYRAASLERSYLTYSHRQRQKSLIIVNAVDLVLKFVLAAVYIIQQQHDV